MINSLPLFHRLAGQPVILLGEGAAAEAKRRLLERVGARIVSADDPAARLAFIALDNPEAVTAALKRRGVSVNVVDRPDLCDFTVPSLLERGPVLIAVGTGGVSAGLSKALRLRLDALLPAGLGNLARDLAAARARLRARWPDTVARRRALDAALTAGGVLDPLADHADGAVDRWLLGAPDQADRIVTIQLRSDDPDDLTVREARWLGHADRLVLTGEIPAAILNRARADAVRCETVTHSQPGLTVVVQAARSES